MSPKQQNQRQQTEPASPWTLVYQTNPKYTGEPAPEPFDAQEPTLNALFAIYDHTQRSEDN